MNDMGPYMTQEEVERCQAELAAKWAEEERQEAYAAVSRAMASYRWWGFTSILCTIRMFITSMRLRLGMKLWP